MDHDHVLAVGANFAADSFVEPLEFWFRELGLPWRVELAPYDQVFQQLLDPASLLRRNGNGLNVILLRLEDWSRGRAGADVLERELEELVAAIDEAAGRSAVTHVVCVCPPSRAALVDPVSAASLADMEGRLAVRLGARSNVELVTGAALRTRYPVTDYDDPQGDRVAHVPYTEELFAALATLLARRVHGLARPPAKVIALDCDQTLWRGVCGEVGPDGVAIEDGHRALQQFVVERRRKGTLLVLCSKNNEADVWRVFAERPDMVIHRHDLAATRLNWQPKSDNLRDLAEELGLELDSFALLDDDPLACAEVRANCPEVLTLKLPTDPHDYGEYLEHVWAFDAWGATSEDSARTARYREELGRREARSSAPSFAEFITGLGLIVSIESPTGRGLARVAQLTVRTNQFNVTGVRRSEAELAVLLESGELEGRVVEVRDRFGDYGLVGVLLHRWDADALVVDTFLLSCRALGRGVEHRMLAELGRLAGAAGKPRVEIPFRATEKNAPARLFLEGVGGRLLVGATVVKIPSEAAAATSFRPEEHTAHDARSPDEARRARSAPSNGATRANAALERIANELRTPGAVLAAVKSAREGTRPRDAEFVAPRTGLEHALAELWATQLGVVSPGVFDDFFASGGHSLQAALLVAQASERFGVEVSLLDFFEAPTVAGLAEVVERRQLETAESEELARALEELGELSDDEVLALLAEEDGRADP